MKGILELCKHDFVKGLLIFVGSALMTYLLQLFGNPEFSFRSTDWHEVMRISLVATATYLSKNLFTTDSGKFAGVVPVEPKK